MASNKANTYRPHEGKLAIVTGASRGIGAAIASNLAAKGANLILNYTSESSATKTQQHADALASKHSIKAYAVRADMGSETGPASLIAATLSHFGDDATISILINNAGIAKDMLLGSIDPAVFHAQYATNVLGPLLLMQAALPHLPHDRSGRIVNISSVSSSLGFAGQSVYGGTKAALESMTRTWARELAERATVNAVNPGPVATDMYANVGDEFAAGMIPWHLNTPLAAVSRERDGEDADEVMRKRGGRAATAEDIAGVVGMLCSPESAWSTGSVVCANGGMRFSP